MGRLKWYKRDPTRALKGMMKLTLEERGAYNTVLDLIYSHDGRLEDDERFIAGWLRTDVRVWRRLRGRLLELGKLFVEDGLIRNSTADAEVLSALSRVESLTDAGRQGGLARARKYEAVNKEINHLSQASAKAGDSHKLNTSTTTSTIRKKKETPPSVSLPGLEFPEWWPKEAWEGFVEMRKRIRAPLTERAVRLAVIEITKFKAEGHNPQAVIDQSTQKSWRGLFPVKNGHTNGNGASGIETTGVDGWLGRLQVFSGLTDSPAGTWPDKWGPRPDQPGCLAPPQALERFKNLRREQSHA